MNEEKIPVRIYEDSHGASRALARRIADLIRERADQGRPAVLGLATGSTPVQVYRELIRMHREEGLDFSNVVTFNLDEYWPIDPEAIQSYHNWMRQIFFRFVNIPEENTHIPSGQVSEENVDEHCRRYERLIQEAGGIDLQILGIGRSGHIGFNEPGSAADSRTRLIPLDRVTRKDAASDFYGEENVPHMAITMGVGTILEARRVCLLAFGEGKAPIARRAVEGPITADVSASHLQRHRDAALYLDEAAAAELTRIATPWLVGPCQWDEMLRREAVLWLARRIDKPISKLTDEDYAENGLGELLRVAGSAYDINHEVFRRMMNSLTGRPAGDQPRRILVLSPHPDDDVICMGGTMARMVEQGHEVHAAYMVSGSLAVFDHNVERHADFVRQFNRIFDLAPEMSARIEEHIDRFLRKKEPGESDTTEVARIKGLIRRTEAIMAARYCGLADEHIHFLDMPFYDTGTVEKNPIGPEDVAIVRRLLERVRPEMIFAAGDMSDPHGTHRQCLQATLEALEDYRRAHPEREAELWFYRGAWQEWSPEQIDMAVPLSPEEILRKRHAIFRHESQKDKAMFPGPYDSREFWQRAEERSMDTAVLYDHLGLPEYHALEAFARAPLARPRHIAAQFERAPESAPAEPQAN